MAMHNIDGNFVRDDHISGIGPVIPVIQDLKTPYYVTSMCELFLVGGQRLAIRLSTDEFITSLSQADQVMLDKHVLDGTKTRNNIIKRIWP